jgi:hypothetical protein
VVWAPVEAGGGSGASSGGHAAVEAIIGSAEWFLAASKASIMSLYVLAHVVL